jgi:hypothetical protein
MLYEKCDFTSLEPSFFVHYPLPEKRAVVFKPQVRLRSPLSCSLFLIEYLHIWRTSTNKYYDDIEKEKLRSVPTTE